jgi:predicted nuclease with RNAse H fold
VIAVGIDLTGSETKPSGWACLRGREAELRRVRTDAELVEATLAAEPTVVSLDSPLGLPRMAGSIIRDAEREMMALRIGVYPCLLPSMVRLTERGIALKRVFEAAGLAVIEGFPGSAQDWLGIPRKKTDVGALRQGLEDYGLVVRAERISHDELDALTAALVGQFWLRGEFHAFGNEEEGVIVTPCRWRGTVQLRPYSRMAENYLAFRWGLRTGESGPVLAAPGTKTNKALFAALDGLAAGAGFERDAGV